MTQNVPEQAKANRVRGRPSTNLSVDCI